MSWPASLAHEPAERLGQNLGLWLSAVNGLYLHPAAMQWCIIGIIFVHYSTGNALLINLGLKVFEVKKLSDESIMLYCIYHQNHHHHYHHRNIFSLWLLYKVFCNDIAAAATVHCRFIQMVNTPRSFTTSAMLGKTQHHTSKISHTQLRYRRGCYLLYLTVTLASVTLLWLQHSGVTRQNVHRAWQVGQASQGRPLGMKG